MYPWAPMPESFVHHKIIKLKSLGPKKWLVNYLGAINKGRPIKILTLALSFCFISELLGDFPIDPFGKGGNDAISQILMSAKNIVNQTIIHY